MLFPALLASSALHKKSLWAVSHAWLACSLFAATGKDTGLYSLRSWPPGSAAALALDAPSRSRPAAGSDDLLAYTRVRSTAFMGWGRAGLHVVTRAGAHPQLHRVAAPRAPLRPITSFPRRVDQWYLNPVPARRMALITLDRGGDEEYSLSLLDLATGKTRDLPCPPGRVTGVLWNDSGTAYLYGHTPKGTGRWDLRLGRISTTGRTGRTGKTGKTGSPGISARDTLVLSRPGTWIPMDWAPDGGSAVIQRHVSSAESELHVLSLAGHAGSPDGPRVTRLLPNDPAQYYDHTVHVRLPGSGETALAFTSDREGPNHRLWLLRPGEDRPAALTPPAPFDVEWVACGGDRRTLVFSRNEDGLSVLHALAPGEGLQAARRLPGIPPGIIDGAVFHPSGREFAFTLNGAAFPGEAFTYDLAAGKAVRWTESGTAGLSRKSFRVPELVRYPTFDSVGGAPRLIPAWLYLPLPARKGGPGGPSQAAPGSPARAGAGSPAKAGAFPVLILIHGGPELQARGGFDPFVQYLVSRGVAVCLPNVRGSSGYGKEYLGLDDGFRRLDAVRDIGALLDWIATRPDLDSRRVAVSGRSYGGFMALASLIRYGDRLAGGISSVGITHFPSFLKETSGYRRDLRRAEYGDERDPRLAAFLDSISPVRGLDRLSKPLLLIHGRNDPRVPYAESVRLFEALKARRVPAWLLTFNREGHAVRSEAAQQVNARVMAEFIFGLF